MKIRLLGLVLLLATAAFGEEAYTYSGRTGYSTNFPLIGGSYTIYVDAHYENNFAARNSCVFGANLQEVAPKHDSAELGPKIPISGPIHYKLGPKPIQLEGGTYALYVASTTTCVWRLTLVSGEKNAAGIQPPLTFNNTPGGLVRSSEGSLKQEMQFTVAYRTENNANTPVTGEIQILHNGTVIDKLPMKIGADDDTKVSMLYVNYKWQPSDTKLIGKNTARAVVHFAGHEYTSTTDFTLK